MQNSQHCIGPNCLLPDTRNTIHTLREEEPTHMSSRIINIAGLVVPLTTGPSTILSEAHILFYITSNLYIINVLTMHSHVCDLHVGLRFVVCN